MERILLGNPRCCWQNLSWAPFRGHVSQEDVQQTLSRHTGSGKAWIVCSGQLAGNHSKVCPTVYWPLVKAQLWIETDGGGKSQKVAGLNPCAGNVFLHDAVDVWPPRN